MIVYINTKPEPLFNPPKIYGPLPKI